MKDSMIAKDFYTYSIKILRQEKNLRDHWLGGEPPREWSGSRVLFG
jgi:hypothetical protein